MLVVTATAPSFAQAYQMMVDRDRAIEQYLSEFMGVQWNDPFLYHLVANTGKLDIETVAQTIEVAIRQLAAAAVPANAEQASTA